MHHCEDGSGGKVFAEYLIQDFDNEWPHEIQKLVLGTYRRQQARSILCDPILYFLGINHTEQGLAIHLLEIDIRLIFFHKLGEHSEQGYELLFLIGGSEKMG